MTLGTPGGYSRSPGVSHPPPTKAAQPTGHLPYTATDPRTGVQTHWEVSSSTQYTDPAASSQRSVAIKRIREVEDREDTKTVKGMDILVES